MTMTADDWIQKLELRAHPEGGYYRETWRSTLTLPAGVVPQGAPRAAGTAIYYLLPADRRSRWHRVASDEIWIHQYGDPVRLAIAHEPSDDAPVHRLGPVDEMQLVVGAGMWQSADVDAGAFGYALVCCVVVPGFDFADFEVVPK